jgi:hypothetical protein
MYDLVHHPMRSEEFFAIFMLLCAIGGIATAITRAILAHQRQMVLDDMEATLKMEMIERGMSGDDIAKVLNIKTRSFPAAALEKLSQAAFSHRPRHSFRARCVMDRAMREAVKTDVPA